jgi:hypothetical protein
VQKVEDVTAVLVGFEARRVMVYGHGFSDHAVRARVDEAPYAGLAA